MGRGAWRSAGELTSSRSIDWAREVRKSQLRRAVMRVLSSLVGPVIRCNLLRSARSRIAIRPSRRAMGLALPVLPPLAQRPRVIDSNSVADVSSRDTTQ